LHFSSVTRFGAHYKVNKRLPRYIIVMRFVAHYQPNERKARYNAVTWISAY